MLLNLLYASKSSRNFQPVFLFEETGPSLTEYQGHGSVFIFPLEKMPFLRKVARKISVQFYDFIKYWYAKRVISSLKPDLLYVNSFTRNPSVRAALSSSTKLVLHAHEMDFLVNFRLPYQWVQATLSRSCGLIACSDAVAEFYERTYGFPRAQSLTIHGPVSEDRLRLNSPAVRFSNPDRPDKIRLGVVANLSFLKGPDLLIEAMYLLTSRIGQSTAVELHWLGTPTVHDPYFQTIESLVKARGLENTVHFLNARPQTAAFYAEIDILVLPSRTEAFPLCILEAMLFEKPVVAMDVGGVREAVDAETGHLVKDRTPEGLAEGIFCLLENEERRKVAGQKGRQRVLERFEANVQAPKWLKILDNL